jgi:hypothetical protein
MALYMAAAGPHMMRLVMCGSWRFTLATSPCAGLNEASNQQYIFDSYYFLRMFNRFIYSSFYHGIWGGVDFISYGYDGNG